MDVCVDILLPRLHPMEGLHQVRRDFEWGGVVYPQEPERHRWGRVVELRKSQDSPAFLLNHLPAGLFPDGFTHFVLEVAALDLLSQEVNAKKEEWDEEEGVDWGGHPLDVFLLEQLSRNTSWAMTFMPHCDQLDFTRETTPQGLVALLKAQLDFNRAQQGFIAWGRNSHP